MDPNRVPPEVRALVRSAHVALMRLTDTESPVDLAAALHAAGSNGSAPAACRALGVVVGAPITFREALKRTYWIGFGVLIWLLAGCSAPLERAAATQAADVVAAPAAREAVCELPSTAPACSGAANLAAACTAAVVADARLRMVQLGDWTGIDVPAYRATWATLVGSGLLSGRLAEYGVRSIAIEGWYERYSQDAYVLGDVAPLQDAPDGPGLVYVFLLAPGQTTTTMRAQGSRGYHSSVDGRPYVFSTYQADPFVVPVHELSEALTDTVPGLGWTSAAGEVADVCQSAPYDVVAGVSVAAVWSQELCGCL